MAEKINISIVPTNAIDKPIEYVSSDESVVQVDGERLLPVGIGTATITATTYNGKTDSTIINVLPSIQNISLNSDDITLYNNQNVTISPHILPNNAVNKELIWMSSDSSVVTVSNSGILTGIKEGTATISVKSSNNIKASLLVKVIQVVEKIIINEENISIDVDESIYLDYTIKPLNATYNNISYFSSNPDVVTIGDDGLIIGITKGESTISITTDNGITSSTSIKVKKTSIFPVLLLIGVILTAYLLLKKKNLIRKENILTIIILAIGIIILFIVMVMLISL